MKTWFVTGSSSGIGRGIAMAALEKGDNAVVMARDVRKLQDIVEQYPETALAVPLELTDKASIRAAVQVAEERFGGIDVLVNNAGHGYRAAVEEGEDDSIAEVFGANLFGAIDLIRAVLPQMRARHQGTIINVSSIAAVHAGVGSGYYAATKAALERIGDALEQEVSPLGIRVMTVEPGAFRTRFYDDSLKGTGLRIGDYAETAGKRHKENLVNHHDQPGDPVRGGKIIVEMIEREDCPGTLLLGTDAVSFVRKQLQEQLEEIDRWEAVSIRSDF